MPGGRSAGGVLVRNGQELWRSKLGGESNEQKVFLLKVLRCFFVFLKGFLRIIVDFSRVFEQIQEKSMKSLFSLNKILSTPHIWKHPDSHTFKIQNHQNTQHPPEIHEIRPKATKNSHQKHHIFSINPNPQEKTDPQPR